MKGVHLDAQLRGHPSLQLSQTDTRDPAVFVDEFDAGGLRTKIAPSAHASCDGIATRAEA